MVKVVSVQNRYNVSDRTSDAVLATCERDGMAFIPWSPLSQSPREPREGARARLAEWANRRGVPFARAAVAWLLARSPAMLPIPGTSNLAHLEDNVAAAELAPAAEDLAAIG